MKRLYFTVILVVLSMLVSLSMLALPQSTAFAASTEIGHKAAHVAALQPHVSCSGNGCTDKDPQSTGCDNGASTVYNTPIQKDGTTIAMLQLRYSPTCGTNWTRITSYVGNALLTANTIRKVDSWIEYGGPMWTTTVWSDMVYSPSNYSVYGDGCLSFNQTGYPSYCADTPLG